jgi:hypothetical protein
MDAQAYYLLSLLTGLAIVSVLSVSEFTRHLRKPKARWQYYFALSIFVAINAAVYLALTYIVVQESPVRLVFGSIRAELSAQQAWTPIATALAYFFAGSGIFRIGKKEIHLFRVLLDALSHLFGTRIPHELPSAVDSAADEYKRLRHLADIYRNRGAGAKWDLLADKWSDFSDQDRLLNELLTELRIVGERLRTLGARLEADSSARRELTALIEGLQGKHDQLLGRLIQKLQHYLFRLGWTNLKDERELERFLGEVGLATNTEEEPPSSMSRSLVIGFLFGLLFGPIFAHFEGKDAIAYMWMGSLTVMVFSGMIAIGMRSEGFIRLGMMGAAAGYAGHLLWNLMEWGMGDLPGLEVGALPLRHLFYEPIIGLGYGATTAALLYLLRLSQTQGWMRPPWGFLLSAGGGALAFPIIHLAMNPSLGTPGVVLAHPFMVMALIGAVVVSATAAANNLCCPEVALETPPPETASTLDAQAQA